MPVLINEVEVEVEPPPETVTADTAPKAESGGFADAVMATRLAADRRARLVVD